jgi:hypothetical protein
VPSDTVVVIQYLDDILFVSQDRPRLASVPQSSTDALTKVGFIISVKSILEPTQLVSWMGKNLTLQFARIAPSAQSIADVVTRWARLALKPYHRKKLQHLLGKIIWLGRPGYTAASFLAGPRAWLNKGAHSVPA